MTCGKVTVFHESKHLFGQIEQADGVGNCTTALADFAREFFLCHIEFFCKRAVCHRLFNGVKIFALEVFHKSNTRGFFIIFIQDNGRNFRQTCEF